MLSEVSRTHEKQILLGFTYEVPQGFPGSSLGKESTCSAGDLIPGSGRSSGEGIGFPLQPSHLAFPSGLDGKESACGAGDLGSVPGLGRSPGGGHGNPL